MGDDKKYNKDLIGVTEESRQKWGRNNIFKRPKFFHNWSHTTNSRGARNFKQSTNKTILRCITEKLFKRKEKEKDKKKGSWTRKSHYLPRSNNKSDSWFCNRNNGS